MNAMRFPRTLAAGAFALAALLAGPALAAGSTEGSGVRATGDLGLVVERADGRVKIVDRGDHAVLKTVSGLGDLSHASVVYSPDERYAYVFGRDGGLTKLDMIAGRIDKRIQQAGNSIGGAISQDGELIAVSNYEQIGRASCRERVYTKV